ncbi:MAG: DNA mismatch endonuclease Vsr [Nitrospiraceae bacterium]|nr:DNA mismatch endonuclease Vsr [Nitrospiraceae bacterium]
MDNLTPEQRSAQMAKVRSRDTKPEMLVRKLVHGMGFRYRLHRRELPGKPDLVFASRRKIIFVNGCFWHGHDCSLGRIPKSRVDFWTGKITSNRSRDEANLKRLRDLGWKSLVVWECQLRRIDQVAGRIRRFLGVAYADGSAVQGRGAKQRYAWKSAKGESS